MTPAALFFFPFWGEKKIQMDTVVPSPRIESSNCSIVEVRGSDCYFYNSTKLLIHLSLYFTTTTIPPSFARPYPKNHIREGRMRQYRQAECCFYWPTFRERIEPTTDKRGGVVSSPLSHPLSLHSSRSVSLQFLGDGPDISPRENPTNVG